MKILIAGLGSIGKRHIKNLLKLGVKDIILYRHSGARDAEFDFPVFDDLDKALEEKPDVVFITNPTSLHMSVAIASARAGAHLFIEKPISYNIDGIEELLKIVKENGIVSFVAYQYRFHPALQKIKELINEGKLGKLIFGRVEVGQYLPDWHPDEDYRKGYSAKTNMGGGAILTLIHEIDYLTWMLGEPKSVSAVTGHFSSLEIDTEDLAELSIRYDNGALGQCHIDYIQKAPSRWLKIVGEKGEVYWDYFKNKVKFFDGKNWNILYEEDNFDKNNMFLLEVKHFLACLDGQKNPVVNIESDLKIFKLALAAKESAKENKTINL